jgi:hypothetical protein
MDVQPSNPVVTGPGNRNESALFCPVTCSFPIAGTNDAKLKRPAKAMRMPLEVDDSSVLTKGYPPRRAPRDKRFRGSDDGSAQSQSPISTAC